ncbi:maleate cis-trans isomerase family protein [Amycolatopsis methanolica]|uniref:Asp/Glu racemase n=1 Tax=Amycolatopsis methanolica 239 TaxID=1068978 RepID=A0A076MX02_AMYME|nr:Asp/Glu racemase [Amycolatopsis methanolica]AIJ22222.1 Asp/Glu racemase [Amycolatopsis methanolica 239]
MKRHVQGPEPQTGVGIVAPYDFARDRELWRWVPPTVSLFIARTGGSPEGDDLDSASALNRPATVRRPTREVCAVGAEVVIYACTACSFVGGTLGEAALRQAMLDAGAPRALTTSGAAVSALRTVKAQRVAVVHPYERLLGNRLRDFLCTAGFDVVACTPLGLPVREVLTAGYAEVAELIRAGDRPDADAIFVSCTALPTYDLIAPLEAELGKPIVTANQATVWAALRALDLNATGPDQTLLNL